jgi:hypothetical protein
MDTITESQVPDSLLQSVDRWKLPVTTVAPLTDVPSRRLATTVRLPFSVWIAWLSASFRIREDLTVTRC